MNKVIEGISKDEPIETNEQGGKQSATPYAMHLMDPYFLNSYYSEDDFIGYISTFMLIKDKQCLLDAFEEIRQIGNVKKEQVLLNVSKVRKEASAKYPPQNWRLIPQEEHINHALCHYLAYKAGDTQDDHLDHCLCRIMFAYSTNVSKGFSYTKHISEE